MPSLTEWSRRHPDAAAAVALFVLPFLLLGRALWPGRVLSPADNLLTVPPWSALAPGFVPANPQLFDVSLVLHPFLIYAGREIAQGHFPLWNPHAFGGAPFFANPQTALLFPLTALVYALPAALALTLMSILKLSAAGLAMYWCLRVLTLGPFPSLLGALAFMLNGALIAWLQYPVGSAMIFLPLVLGTIERLRACPRRCSIVVLAVVVALDVFAGYPQGAFLGLLVATAWALYRAPGAGAVGFLLRYATGVVLGAGLAAVQLLPFIEYARESAVLAYRAEWLPQLTLSFRSAMSFLMPYYYGSPTSRDYWGEWDFNETAVSVGLVPLMMLPVALAAGWRRTGTKFFLGLALASAAMLYGVPLVSPALAALPGLSLVIAVRLAPLVAFPLCALCAIALDALTHAPPESLRRTPVVLKSWFIALAAAALVVLADDYATLLRVEPKLPPFVQYVVFLALFTLAALLVLHRLRGGVESLRWQAALVAVELASLLPLAVEYNPVIDARWLYPAPPAVQHLQRNSPRESGRVLLEANVPMLYGLDDVSGYDGLNPRRFEGLVRAHRVASLPALTGNNYIGAAEVLASPLVDLFGVRRVVVRPDATLPAPRFVLEYEGRDARIYRNEWALPRAFLVGRARCVDDGEAAQLVARAAFDFREEVLLAECVQPEPVTPIAGKSGVEIRSYAPERVVIRATAGAPGYLVLTDAWFPGWRVWVDGAERPLRRADYAFRAVWLDRGAHEVEFRYLPAAFRWGLAASALAAIVLALLLLRPRRRASAAGAVAITLLILGAGPGEAALPRAPLDFSVSPSTVRQDERATVRLEPRGAAAAGAAFDVYVIWFVSGGVAFLAPDGAWSAQPVPILTGLTAGRLAPAVRELQPPARTVGSLPLAALYVRSGGQPLARPDWVYQPALRVVRLKASIAGDLSMGRAAGVLGGLGLLTLAACAAVAFYPRRRLSSREE